MNPGDKQTIYIMYMLEPRVDNWIVLSCNSKLFKAWCVTDLYQCRVLWLEYIRTHGMIANETSIVIKWHRS